MNNIKKVLIIGSKGFIGSYVKKSIEANNSYEIFEGSKLNIDLRNIKSFINGFNKVRPDVIINLAAFSHLDKSSYENIFELNCFAIIRIIEFLIKEKYSGRFINTSSALVYGSQVNGLLSEDMPLKPDHTYAVAKSTVDNLFNLIQKDLRATSVRPFNCIGVGHRMDYVVPKIINHFIKKKKTIELGDISAKRDFIDVRDVGEMYHIIAKSEQTYPAINLCSGKVYSIKKIVEMLEEISNQKIKIISKKKFMRASDNKLMQGDNKIIKSLGFEYLYDINETLEWIYKNS